MSIHLKHSGVFIGVLLYISSIPGFAGPQTDSVILYTPYTKISVTPGQSVDYQVDLINNNREIITTDLSVRGLPSSWNYSLKYLAYNIQQVSVLPGEKKSINLSIVVPLKVNKGSYSFRLVAGNLSELSLIISVTEQGTFKTEFTTDQANMQGNNTSLFTYQTLLRNVTSEKQLYALMADVPPGWNVVFKNNYRDVTSVEINENTTANISVEIDPPDMIEAGIYRIPVHASTNSTKADLFLEAVIKGSYSMELTTPNGLLSTGITAGDQKRLALIVNNTGSVALRNIQLTANTPINWEVTLEPDKIDLIEPGKTAQAVAVIKASGKAIAGDYVTSIEAKTQEISSKAQIRISVRTSMLWGWIGILIICAALGGVYYLFRKYGRR